LPDVNLNEDIKKLWKKHRQELRDGLNQSNYFEKAKFSIFPNYGEISTSDYFNRESELIPLIKSLGNNISYVEVGVAKAVTLKMINDECLNVEKIYGVDAYKEYHIWSNEITVMYASQDFCDYSLKVAQELIKNYEKMSLIIKDSIEAAKDFDDNSVNFVFLDTSNYKEDIDKNIQAWLPKIKTDGIIPPFNDLIKSDYESNVIKTRE
jgi:hypothetical protein